MTLATPRSSLAGATASDDVLFWRDPRYDDLECLKATFRRHRYARHTHETYAIAAVLDGCEAFHHRGRRNYAPAGSLALVNPDEVHDGEPAGQHFVYRTIYPTVGLMRAVAADVWGRPVKGTPRFSESVVEDQSLADALAHVHAALEVMTTPLLARDLALTAFLAFLLGRHGGFGAPPETGPEPTALRRARDLIDARFAEDLSLDDLVEAAGIPRARLIRAFSRALGVTPHAYLVDRRFRAASRLLAFGEPPAAVATACGFFDQSHLNRVFKARMGVTPGAYRGAP